MIFAGAISAISVAAKGLFSGANKAARQERKQLKEDAKQAAKEAKETAKAAITGGGKTGATIGAIWAKLVTWFKANWQIVAIIAGALVVIWFLFFKKKRTTRRRRSTGSKGSASMKARMARVRAARRRKK